MDYVCEAFKRLKRWWYPEKPCLLEPLEPLNPRKKIMDAPPTLKQLEKEMSRKSTQDLDKVVYFYKPKNKLP